MGKKLLFLLIFSLIFISGCVQQENKETSEQISTAVSVDERQQQPEQTSKPEIKPEMPIKAMTFEITIPDNTPEGDTVWIYVMQLPYKMKKIYDSVYSITLNETNLFGEGYKPQGGELIRYRYSRNSYDFKTAEYLEPTLEEPDRDTNNYFWTKHGREIKYHQGKIQKDAIKRWRWFPEQGIPPRTTNREPDREFVTRINNFEFRSGQTIEDLYVPAFHDFFNSTAKHLKEQSYTWVEIAPPWQWTEINGLPEVINDIANAPNYPDDETFLEELRAYKREGLKVMVGPQLCCTPLNTASKPTEWWTAYFDETEKFLVHFAKLSQQGGADAFFYKAPYWQMENIPVDVEEKMRKIWASVREVFDGEIGEAIGIMGPKMESPEENVPPSPLPTADFLTWGDDLDFFYVGTDYPLSLKDDPTDEELQKRAGEVIDSTKEFYNHFQKPVMVLNGYFNVKYSWKGQTFYSISSIPWIGDPEVALIQSKYQFDTVDHTRTINAYFQAIAERPWVIGYFHFGYTHWEDPLSPWMSVRGKPAEDIWRKWNEVIYDE